MGDNTGTRGTAGRGVYIRLDDREHALLRVASSYTGEPPAAWARRIVTEVARYVATQPAGADS